MIKQLNPPLPMVCPKGEGFAHFLIDYGPESDLYWTIFITATGEIWTVANRDVRAAKNITLGRIKAMSPDELSQLGDAIKKGASANPMHATIPDVVNATGESNATLLKQTHFDAATSMLILQKSLYTNDQNVAEPGVFYDLDSCDEEESVEPHLKNLPPMNEPVPVPDPVQVIGDREIL